MMIVETAPKAIKVAPKTVMQRFLDSIEKVGNMVPHPVVIFLSRIGIVIVLSVVLSFFGTAVTHERINPETNQIETVTTTLRSLLDSDGIRFMYRSLIPNFMSFTAVGPYRGRKWARGKYRCGEHRGSRCRSLY